MPLTLDHIVILVPHHELQALPSWLTESFAVAPGGRHADGITENKLILLQDGVYIELIAFRDDGDESRRRSHHWGAQPNGHIIDWGLNLIAPTETTASRTQGETTDDEFKRIQARVRAAGAGLAYQDLFAGRRTTPDGVVLEWSISSPAVLLDDGNKFGPDLMGGLLPFWVVDRTDRKLRVPYASDAGRLARHPSAAIGVAGVTLHLADPALLDRLRRVYSVLLLPVDKKAADDEWELAVPEKSSSHGRLTRLKLVLLDEDSKEKIQPTQGSIARDTTIVDVKGWIELSLFTTGESRIVGGYFVDGWRIDIRLEHA